MNGRYFVFPHLLAKISERNSGVYFSQSILRIFTRMIVTMETLIFAMCYVELKSLISVKYTKYCGIVCVTKYRSYYLMTRMNQWFYPTEG